MGKKYYPGKLKPEFKAKWIAALRSGEFKQGKQALNPEPGHYCCLGVACVIDNKTLTRIDPLHNGTLSLGLPLGEDAATWWEILPSPRSWVDSPRVKRHGRWVSLTELNDDAKIGFVGIAKLIEEQL